MQVRIYQQGSPPQRVIVDAETGLFQGFEFDTAGDLHILATHGDGSLHLEAVLNGDEVQQLVDFVSAFPPVEE